MPTCMSNTSDHMVELPADALVTATGGGTTPYQLGLMGMDSAVRSSVYLWGNFARLVPGAAPAVNAVERMFDATGHSPMIRKVW
jgi:hypothetical protein